MPHAKKSFVIQIQATVQVTFMQSKSDRDGYGIIGTRYKRMDRWMSECNGERRVRKHSDCKRIKYLKIYVDLMDHLECV